MFTAFLAINLALQDTLRFDYELSQKRAWVWATLIPLALFLIIRFFDLAGFVDILGLGGAISGGLLAIAILWIHEHLQDRKTERKSEFKIKIPLIIKMIFMLLFLAGILYELFLFFT
jgi:hypothetical protein